MNRKAHLACNFNCLFENERLLSSQGHSQSRTGYCKCGNVSETVEDGS